MGSEIMKSQTLSIIVDFKLDKGCTVGNFTSLRQGNSSKPSALRSATAANNTATASSQVPEQDKHTMSIERSCH